MENSILTQIKKFIQSEFVESLGVSTGESRESIQRAYDVTIPALLVKLDEVDATTMQNVLARAQQTFSTATDFHTQLGVIPEILASLFGTGYDTIKNSVSQYAQISTTTSDSVIKTSMMAIFDYFRDLTPDWDFSIIQNFLAAKLPEVKGMVPASFPHFQTNPRGSSTSEQQEKTDIHTVVEPVTSEYKTHDSPYSQDTVEKKSSYMRILIPILLAVVVLFFLYRMCSDDNNRMKQNKITADTIHRIGDSTSHEMSSQREPQEVILHNGTQLHVYKGGIEEQLVDFLEKGEYKTMSEEQLKAIWFDFDYLNFETGSATITPDSKVQLDNIVAILQAYPDTKIKIGGYTDRVGDESTNKRLSSDRANAVKDYLTNKGLRNQIDDAEGYGSEFAKYPSDAPESQRVLDRRVSIRVRNNHKK